MTLRPYQERAISQVGQHWLAGTPRVLLVLPTGAGKTHTLAHAMRLWGDAGSKVLFLVHRTELLRQTAHRLQALGVRVGIVTAGERYVPGTVDVGTVQTVRRRAELPQYDVVVCDEAHRRDYLPAMERWPDARWLGLTATPQRMGGEPLGEDGWGAMVTGLTYSEGVAQGVLCAPRMYAPVRPDLSGVRTVAGDWNADQLAERMVQGRVLSTSLDHWDRLARKPDGTRMRSLFFAANIAHADAVARELQQRGHSAEVVHSGTDEAARASTFARFANGTLPCVVNVLLFVEGVDVPGVECVVLMRPTQSLTYFLQMCGRASRPAPGKADYLLLDCAGCVYRHGSPAQDREWRLHRDPDEPRKRKAADQVADVDIRVCPQCFAVYEPPACRCGFRPQARAVQEADADLVEVRADQLAALADGAPDQFEKERRRAYAIASARFSRNDPRFHAEARRLMQERRTVVLAGVPTVLPKNPTLLW